MQDQFIVLMNEFELNAWCSFVEVILGLCYYYVLNQFINDLYIKLKNYKTHQFGDDLQSYRCNVEDLQKVLNALWEWLQVIISN